MGGEWRVSSQVILILQMANISVLTRGKMQRLKKVRSFVVTLVIYVDCKEVSLDKLSSLTPITFFCPHLTLAGGRHIQVSSVQELVFNLIRFS